MPRAQKTNTGVGNQTIETHGCRDGKLTLSGTHVSTTVVEYSTDNFTTTEVLPLVKNDGTIAQNLTANATVRFSIPPEPGKIRSRISAFTSGSPVHDLTIQ